MLVEGLACVFHGERVTGTGALARGARVRVGDAPPRAPALDSRFRGNDDGGVGARGSCQGGGCTAPRPCPGFPLSGTMGALARVRVRVGDAPPRAPALDSRFRGGGARTAPRPCPGFPLWTIVGRGVLSGWGGSRERRWGRWREGFVSGWGMHRPAPLPWIPAFAGTTMGECGFGKGACRGVAGSGDGKAALRTGPSTGSGRTDSGRPPEDGPFESLRTGSGRRDLGSARHAMGFERPSGLWHHCQGSVVGVWGSTLYAREGGGRTTAS